MKDRALLEKELIRVLRGSNFISLDEKEYLIEHIELFNAEELQELIDNNQV